MKWQLHYLLAQAAVGFSFSFNAFSVDIEAGPIWNIEDAKIKCPAVCTGLKWNGQWTTTQEGVMSVCGTSAGVDIPIGAIWNNDDAKEKCPPQLAKVTWNGNWKTTEPGVMSVCGCKPPAPNCD